MYTDRDILITLNTDIFYINNDIVHKLKINKILQSYKEELIEHNAILSNYDLGYNTQKFTFIFDNIINGSNNVLYIQHTI